MSGRVRVFGSCYVCGKLARGYRAVRVPGIAHERGKVVVRDPIGLRHGNCSQVRGASGVTPSDA